MAGLHSALGSTSAIAPVLRTAELVRRGACSVARAERPALERRVRTWLLLRHRRGRGVPGDLRRGDGVDAVLPLPELDDQQRPVARRPVRRRLRRLSAHGRSSDRARGRVQQSRAAERRAGGVADVVPGRLAARRRPRPHADRRLERCKHSALGGSVPAAYWVRPASGTNPSNSWGINVRIPVTTTGADLSSNGVNLGGVPAASFKFWYAIWIELPASNFAPFYWPRGADFGVDASNNPAPPVTTSWDTVTLGSGGSCGNGISLAYSDIGNNVNDPVTGNPAPDEVLVSLNTPAPVNHFFAKPLNPARPRSSRTPSRRASSPPTGARNRRGGTGSSPRPAHRTTARGRRSRSTRVPASTT